MTEQKPRTSLYGPMPPIGTTLRCDFCRELVTLKQAASGWHYWCADGDPVDGARYCDGGTGPGTVDRPPLWTLHVPAPAYEDDWQPVERWFHRYTPDGVGRFA